MTDCENEKLAQLVTYLLESQDWKKIYLSEVSEPIRLFMFKTGISYRKVHKYITEALQKLLGPVFNVTQRRLANKCCGENDLLFKPKPKLQQQPKNTNKKHHHNAGRTLVPWSEFGRKYLEHYRLSVQPRIRHNMNVKESSLKKRDMLPGKLRNKKSRSGIYATCFLYVRLII